MPNPQLTKEQIKTHFTPLFQRVVGDLVQLAGGDEGLLFALRRKLAKELTYEERSGPSVRKRLKRLKREAQKNICPVCRHLLPPRYCVLDRLEAPKGYTMENTRLICDACDRQIQEDRNFA
jgi:hypothetical protein